MAKKQVEQVEETVAEQSAPVSKPQYSEAQLYKQQQDKKKADAETAKRKEVLEKVKGTDYKPELCGTWLSYTEPSGIVSPSMVISERFATIEGELKMILSVYVFSSRTAQPYKAELTY